MPTTQHPPIGRTATAPTAAQRVVAAMWSLGEPATAKAIAEAAGIGYSTATPVLRNLLADNQAVKTDDATGPARWQLTATLPTPTPAPAPTASPTSAGDDAPAPPPPATNPDPAPPHPTTSDATAHDGEQPGSPHPTDTALADTPGADISAGFTPDSRSGSDDTTTDTDTDAGGAGESDTPAADHTTPQAPADAGQQPTARTYSKPAQPRRPKGHLRAAVLAVLTTTPERAFKVSEVCKAIDAANTDCSANKAGAGAVANALDKLVTSGDAIRDEEAKYATYQAAPAGG
jgi:hypothetical protein